jgi:cell division protein FtsW
MLKFKNKTLLITVITLSIFGIIMIYSASSIWAQYKYNDQFKYVKAQALFFIVGLVLMYILSKVDYKIYEHKANKILLVCFILLILVLIPGIGKLRNGSRSWFGIGSLGIQPSEFAKIGLDIFVAKYLANNDARVKNIWDGIMPILGVIFLFFGLIMLEPVFEGIVH